MESCAAIGPAPIVATSQDIFTKVLVCFRTQGSAELRHRARDDALDTQASGLNCGGSTVGNW
jgi:hypothetical protein